MNASRPRCTIGLQMRFLPVIALATLLPAAAQSQQHLGKPLRAWQEDLNAPTGIDRLLAIRSIGEMAVAGHSGSSAVLLSALVHADSSVRYWAATAAVHIPSLKLDLMAGLRNALTDKVPEVQVQAAHALIEAGEESPALETLSGLLSHDNRGVRLQAAHALDAIGARAAPAANELRLAMDDEFDYVRRVARHALWTLGERPCPYQECE